MNEFINKIIEENSGAGTLFVLKGYSITNLGRNMIDIQKTMDNKIARLFSLMQEDSPLIAYDEFVCLFPLLLEQYKKIIIIENAQFWNLFIPDALLSESISEKLLNHFSEETDVDPESIGLSEYLQVYSNYLQTEKGIACCYNLDDSMLKNPKVSRMIYPGERKQLEKDNTSHQYVNICTEEDYFDLLMNLQTGDNVYSVSWENYIAGKEIICRYLEILNALYPKRLYETSAVEKTQNAENHRQEVFDILNRYWHYDSFRSFKTYDLDALKNKEKKVNETSQEQIINDLIEQTENCINGKDHRDIFVTAPTGSGKSLMFQIPAIYLAEKYNLVTLVITPLIGLMNDQVQALSAHGYSGAETINSDISPVVKQEILERVANGTCHVLYLSPESLQARSDIEQLIGNRKIGMIIVDEAHIVTTWGKQFRPDYWYLGDHVRKLRQNQTKREDDPQSFVIATFTATAIYQGNEDMYHETINSLHLLEPITYLGYVRRNNISIDISEVSVIKNKVEYEIDKYDSLIKSIKLALFREPQQKMLIYFPTVTLIESFYSYCFAKGLGNYVTKYHGQMDASQKDENFQNFRDGKKKIMIATKAFGMGIDIPDIAYVCHFAPTGNVCDYMQEIGRAARKESIEGHAVYSHMANDFKYINRLHGLSAIYHYQLVEVIKKVLEIYQETRYKSINGSKYLRKKNSMLIDAESFAYIFETPLAQKDDSELINKVKTAMLLIQKDFEMRKAYSPFTMRPIPLFAQGYFSMKSSLQKKLNEEFPDSVRLADHSQNIYEVNLKAIWDNRFSDQISFPKFKYMLYTKDETLDFAEMHEMIPAMKIDVYPEENGDSAFERITNALRSVVRKSISENVYVYTKDIVKVIKEQAGVGDHLAQSFVPVVIASMDTFAKQYSKRMNNRVYKGNETKNGEHLYLFLAASGEYFSWLERNYRYIMDNVKNNVLYVMNDTGNSSKSKEIITAMGVLEACDVLSFKALGGNNSQIYIHVNDTKDMQMIKDRPYRYKNRLLEMINSRHKESVKMLTFLFENGFSSDQIWDHLENYFLGILPDALTEKKTNKQKSEDSSESYDSLRFQIGESLQEDYPTWTDVLSIFDKPIIRELTAEGSIPVADYYQGELIIGDSVAEACLVWYKQQIALTDGEETASFRKIAEENGWLCIPLDEAQVSDISHRF